MTPSTETPPVLSVVVPAHDVAPWIDELLQSVLDAGVDSLEVVVIDDHSTDDTASRVAAFARRDPRIVHHITATYGAAQARNVGVRLARGRYLIFADGDDLIPRGAYAVLLASLEGSGSDFAIGDHLKFSPGATWSPTARWYPFDTALTGIPPREVPALVSGRAAWNRMFRRSFWDASGLVFPEVPRTDDIVPMTRAFMAATAIDVVPHCVYLYRERPGTTSMTAGTPAEDAARLYFEQEVQCAALVAALDDPGVTEQYSTLVFDADGWVHLSTYLEQLAPSELAAASVMRALGELLRVAPRESFEGATAVRRALFALVEGGRVSVARDLALADARVRATHQHDAESLAAWSRALAALDEMAEAADLGLDLHAVAVEGPLTALANDAALVDTSDLASTVAMLVTTDAVATIDVDSLSSDVLRWMVAAVRSGDAAAVRRVSLVRRAAPLTVNVADAAVESLHLAGPAPVPEALLGASIRLHPTDGGEQVDLPVELGLGGWSAEVPAASLAWGRASVNMVVADGYELPLVTARMPLPPVPDGYALQPLADRRRGWIFLVDRKTPPTRGLFAAARARLRR